MSVPQSSDAAGKRRTSNLGFGNGREFGGEDMAATGQHRFVRSRLSVETYGYSPTGALCSGAGGDPGGKLMTKSTVAEEG